jgi:uncharacterized protein YycO
MNRLLELETQLQGPGKPSGGGLAPRRSAGSRAKLIPWGKRPAAKRKAAGAKDGAATNGASKNGGGVAAAKSFSAAGARRSRGFNVPVNYEVPNEVPAIRQPSSMTCWATVTTMMMSWLDGKRRNASVVLPIPEALARVGQTYVNKFNANKGLATEEKAPFLAAAGFVALNPQSFPVSEWEAMLRTYGPLWVTTDEDASPGFAIHARIMTGIKGDGTPDGTQVSIVDPAGGRTYKEKLSTFIRKFEEEAHDTDPRTPLRIQVVHWPHNAALTLQQSADIPLDPGAGGQSIGQDSLDVGDVILSTTSDAVSRGIRAASGAQVSHSMLYVGGGQVVEAIGSGVVLRSLADAIGPASVAVAFRHPEITTEKALMVRDFAGQHLGKEYNYWGIVRQALFRLDMAAFCRGKSGEDYDKCRNWVGKVNLGAGGNDTFFCSQLVLAAFKHAGLPLTSTDAHWESPGDLAELRLSKRLGYVGHLKA